MSPVSVSLCRFPESHTQPKAPGRRALAAELLPPCSPGLGGSRAPITYSPVRLHMSVAVSLYLGIPNDHNTAEFPFI